MEYVRKGGKQVMKKKIAVVLTALMVMAMGTTAFAATSPTTKTSETTTTEATAYANVTVAADGIVIDGVASTAAPTVKAVTTAQVEAAQTQAVASVAPTAKVLQMIDVTLPVSFEKAQLTFSVNGVTAGQKIAVLHQKLGSYQPGFSWKRNCNSYIYISFSNRICCIQCISSDRRNNTCFTNYCAYLCSRYRSMRSKS